MPQPTSQSNPLTDLLGPPPTAAPAPVPAPVTPTGAAGPTNPLEDLLGPPGGAVPPQGEHPLTTGAKSALERGLSAVQWLGHKLGAPQQALYKGIQQAQRGGLGAVDPTAIWEHTKGTFSGETPQILGEDLLGEAGLPAGFARSALGLGVDVVADPLNALGIGVVQKGLKAATAPLRAVADVAMSSPTFTRPLQTVMAHVGPKEYRNLKTLHQAARQGEAHHVMEQVARAGVPIREDPVKTFEQLPQVMEYGVTPDTPADVAQTAQQLAALLDAHKQRALAAGTLSEEHLLKNIGYLPRVFHKPGEAPRVTFQAGDAPPEPKGFMLNPANRLRTTTSRAESLAAGALPDPFESIARHLTEGGKLAKDAEFIKSLAESGGKHGLVLAPGQVPPAGFRTLEGIRTETGIPFAKALGTYAFPKVIAGDLERMVARAPEYGDLGKVARMFNQAWKNWTTTANPAFHTTNFVGNAAQAITLGEMNPLMVVPRMAQATGLLMGSPKAAQARFGALSGAEAIHTAKLMGVVGAEFGQFHALTEDIADAFKTMGIKAAPSTREAIKAGLRGQRLNPAEHYLAFMQRAGKASEDTWRLAKFLDDLAQGKTPEEATLGTIKTFFAYDQLSPDMKKIRDIAIPFATWSAKNIPAKLRQFVTRPDLAMREVKVIRALEEPDEDQQIPLAQQPEFAKERGAITARFTTAGGQPVLLDPNLPVQDVEQLRKLLPPALAAVLGMRPEGDAEAPGIADQALEVLKSAAGIPGGMLSKPVAMPTELLTGRELRSGNELWRDPRWTTHPETGEALPTAMRRAPWPIQAAGALAPQLAEATGAQLMESPNPGEPARWEMPALKAWLLRSLIPGAFNTAGQAMMTLSDVDDPSAALAVGPSATLAPWQLRMLTGATGFPVTAEQAERNQRYDARDAEAAIRAALRTAGRRHVPTTTP